jgi:hypothetical protein
MLKMTKATRGRSFGNGKDIGVNQNVIAYNMRISYTTL